MANETEPSAFPPPTTQESKRILAGVLAIVLGGFGVHKFVLGYTMAGILMLAVGFVSFVTGLFCFFPLFGYFAVWVVGLVEGITYLTKTDEQFVRTYQVGKKEWF